MLKMAWNLIKIASDKKVFNCKVLRLVETVDFDVKIVLIRGCMRKLQPVQDAATLDGRTLRVCSSGFWISLLQTSENSRKIPQDGLRSKNVQHESCSSRRNGQGCFWARFHSRSFIPPNMARKMQPDFTEQFWKVQTKQIRIGLGFWTWIEAFSLHGKSSRLLYT